MKKIKQNFEEVSLVYKNKTRADNRPSVKSPAEAYEILIKNWDLNQIGLLEEFKILLLDRRLRLMSIASIAKGGLSSVHVDPRVVFSIALKRRADQIILAHNHPSECLSPSRLDIELTDQFTQIGEVLNIEVADHLIITEHGFHSIVSGCTVKIEIDHNEHTYLENSKN